MKNKKYTIALVTLCTILLCWGCKETMNLCPADQVPYLNCNFTFGDDFYADTFALKLVDLDTVLYAAKSAPASISIPIPLNTELIEFSIYFHEDTIDYFTIKHSPNVVFESPDCGFVISFELDSVIPHTKQKIDSVFILNPIIDKEQYENIEIVF